jgi:GDP-4-dehydro-6-deoxy-D-mannose reductase
MSTLPTPPTPRTPLRASRVLITGITGSGGSYLAEHLLDEHPGVEVHGLSRWHSTTSADNLRAIASRVAVHEADLLDTPAIVSVLRGVRPDAIFHLASHANVRVSFTSPTAVVNNNVMGTVNLFEAIRLAGINPIVQLCSTSEVYGQVDPSRVPITEDTPLVPVSPYAVSKVTQDLLGGAYWMSYGLRVIRTRMFTYVNPRRTDLFATAFARQVARIEQGVAAELVHGNLDSVRTLLDVRDAMRAYAVTVEKGEPGEIYNIGGTTTMKVGDVLDRLLRLARCRIPTRVDPALLRPADVTLQIPCVDKFTAATGWRPVHGFDDSLEHLLNYWRHEAAVEASAPARPLPRATKAVA